MKALVITCSGGLGDSARYLPIIRKFAEGKELTLVVSSAHVELFRRYLKAEFLLWDEKKSNLKNVFEISRKLLKRKFEIALATYPDGRRENLLMFITRAKTKRIYYDGNRPLWRLQFLNIPYSTFIDFKKAEHDVVLNTKLFDTKAEMLLEKCEGNVEYIVMHPGVSVESRRWDIENFAEICRRLVGEGTKVVAIGNKDELEILGRLKEAGAHTFSGSISETIEIMKRATAFLGNDSSMAIISALLGVPTLTIFTYADYRRTAPVGTRSYVIRLDLDCCPCYNFAYGYKRSESNCKRGLKCKDIGVEEVWTVFSKIIKGEEPEFVTKLPIGTKVINIKNF